MRELSIHSQDIPILTSQTKYKDGKVKKTQIADKVEIVGYFGYYDDKGYVKAIGLISYEHPK